MKRAWRNNRDALLFLSPFLLSFTIFFLYAFVNALRYSFTDYNLFNTPSWVGLTNYVRVFRDPDFIRAIVNTLAYSFIVTAVQTFLALLLAVLLNQKLRGIPFFRTLYYLPSILSSAAVTLIFLWLWQRNGFINYSLTWLNEHAFVILGFLVLFTFLQMMQVLVERSKQRTVSLFDPAFATLSLILALIITALLVTTGWLPLRDVAPLDRVWLNTRERFLGLPIPLWAIMIQNIYTTIPGFMLLFLAGLQDVPKSMTEAAAIDGANVLQRFWLITVPLLRPVSFLVVTLSLIGTLQLFDQVELYGDAAPLESKITLAYYVYQAAFPEASASRIGEASAAALILGLLTLLVVLVQRGVGIKEEGYR
jgi:multiple sugar transport system permease protein